MDSTIKQGTQQRSGTAQLCLQQASHKLCKRLTRRATCSRFRVYALHSLHRPSVHGASGSMRSSRVCKATAAAEASSSASGNTSSYVDDSRAFAVAMAKIADDTKATDLTVLHVEPLVSWCSYMVVCSVMSRPQLLAVLARMEDAAVADWGRSKQNSAGSSQWEVLDFGDVVAHVFTAEQREVYDLDSFYAAAEEVPLPFVEDSASSSREQAEQQSNTSSKSSIGSAGPVWSKNL